MFLKEKVIVAAYLLGLFQFCGGFCFCFSFFWLAVHIYLLQQFIVDQTL